MKQHRNKSRQESPESFFHQPFRVLKGMNAATSVAPPERAKAVPPAKSSSQPAADDDSIFLQEMSGVQPLREHARRRVEMPPPASPPRESNSEDAEALAELCDLVSGSRPFDITQSDEHVEGAVAGLDPRLLRRLRGGQFAYQDHLDLHGCSSEEARVKVEAFLTHAQRTQKRCVLIVHGRGLNSKDQVPVLKSRLMTWLTRGQWAKLILAFSSARACDGGVGALYVLLRRERQARQPIRVTNGAKW